jgi:hypothetical protein
MAMWAQAVVAVELARQAAQAVTAVMVFQAAAVVAQQQQTQELILAVTVVQV